MNLDLSSTENKLDWCKAGEIAENNFLAKMLKARIGIFANPAKSTDPYTHDMYMVLPADLKTCRTPFRTSDRYGFDPKTAITIDKKDIDRYSKLYPNIMVIFDVSYEEFGFERLCYAPLKQLVAYVNTERAKHHVYLKRKNDTKGNAKDCYVMDSMWFQEIA